ncbi:MAG: hypothetical protein PHP45_04305 [Elusimicrobiales bacterium]|nr:hypothetical protein [Elusimicrobiales bacterium]
MDNIFALKNILPPRAAFGCALLAASAFALPAAKAADLVPAFAVQGAVPAFAPARAQSGQTGKPAPADFDFNPEAVKDADVVIISACGLEFGEMGFGALRLKHIKSLLRYWFAAGAQDDARWNPALEKYQRLVAKRNGVKPAHIPSSDTYLEETLERKLAGTGRKYLIVPLRWSRNPDTTRLILPEFLEHTREICAAAAKYNKPVYVVCHSWGTLLMHAALNWLAEEGSSVRVSKFITLSSPLMPSAWWLGIGVQYGIIKGGLPFNVKKPSNVEQWLNFWARRDIISNAIAAADVNIRVDTDADRYALRLHKAALEHGPYYLDAMAGAVKADKAALNDPVAWHESFERGFHAEFKSLGDSLDVDTFIKFVIPAAFAQ